MICRSLQSPVFWDLDPESSSPGKTAPSFPPCCLCGLVLPLLLLIFTLHVVGAGGEATNLPILLSVWSGPAGLGPPEEARGPRLRGSSDCEQHLLLPVWPQPAPPTPPPNPMLLGAVCSLWLQGLINSGWAQRFEMAG